MRSDEAPKHTHQTQAIQTQMEGPILPLAFTQTHTHTQTGLLFQAKH